MVAVSTLPILETLHLRSPWGVFHSNSWKFLSFQYNLLLPLYIAEHRGQLFKAVFNEPITSVLNMVAEFFHKAKLI